MTKLGITSALLLALVATLSPTGPAMAEPVPADVGPQFQSIGPLTFGPDGVLFAADNKAARIYAIDLGDHAAGKTAGAADTKAIDQKIASMLGTDARELTITDLAIHPESRNAFLSAQRGQGDNAQAVLLRVDGAGEIAVETRTPQWPTPAGVRGDSGRRVATALGFKDHRKAPLPFLE